MSLDRTELLKVHPAARLNADGQCCGRKPHEYARPHRLFCSRCDRSYDVDSKVQVPNFAWVTRGDGFSLCQASAGAKIVTEMWTHQKGSGLDQDTYRLVVLDEIDAFNAKYQETFAP